MQNLRVTHAVAGRDRSPVSLTAGRHGACLRRRLRRRGGLLACGQRVPGQSERQRRVPGPVDRWGQPGAGVGAAGRYRGVHGRRRGRPMVVVAGRPASRRGDAPRAGVGAADGGGRHLRRGGRARAVHDDRRAGRRAGRRRTRDGRPDRCHPLRRRCRRVDHLPVGGHRPHRGDHRHAAGQPRAPVGTTAVRCLVARAVRVRGRGRARREPTRGEPSTSTGSSSR